jgi:Peptidase family C25
VPKKADKVVLSNGEALRAKYGSRGAATVRRALRALVTADRRRGLTTTLVFLDEAPAMRKLAGRAVTDAASRRQNKDAVDAVYRSLAPDYILLAGAIDIIPHQDLRNPLFTSPGGDDTDSRAYGDLPYACEAPYSRDPADFIGPTRVVGRLPDVTGARSPSFFLTVIKNAADAAPMAPDAYDEHFAVSAQIWLASTRLSLRNMFGGSAGVATVPPRSAAWPSTLLRRRVHFINCHGASRASEFFGQPASGRAQYPIALRASHLDGRVSRGTIVAAECCYGAQLAPVSRSRPRLGICETYLANGAWGFLGSTTIAYGDFERNGSADLICQYFLDAVRAGASLGRAVLEARQRFVAEASPINPSELKTIAQFNLYGDPSVTPIRDAAVRGVRPTTRAASAAHRSERHDRRRALFNRGLDLSTRPVPRRTTSKPAAAVRRALAAEARRLKLRPHATLSFTIRPGQPPPGGPRHLFAKAAVPRAYHVLFCRRSAALEAAADRAGVTDIVALIAQEVDGTVSSFARIHSR